MACGVRQQCCKRWYALFWIRATTALTLCAIISAGWFWLTGWRYAPQICAVDGAVCAAVIMLRRSEGARGYVRYSDRIVLSRGALFPVATVVFCEHISFAVASASPLERLLRLRTLTLRTAGGAVKLRGLEISEAERLRNNLIHARERKAV